ncbi:hypothetical protein RVR_868 [Actinacidiphila reveromycinica]|uniref:Uncharacterized protein n=1 Tax=Actinacidiphila reveromycinica TaxID=659352 RepID=A0A7U3UNK9_9ACTN|nr:hypothetical protein [Streptomyces sp. SN-593]BBA95846.1 hypothetical protein RVR_868 [Streptomyces sp. SN-593]
MADAVDPTNEDTTAETENEVEAHSEALDLQEMGVSGLEAPGSTVSLAACA